MFDILHDLSTHYPELITTTVPEKGVKFHYTDVMVRKTYFNFYTPEAQVHLINLLHMICKIRRLDYSISSNLQLSYFTCSLYKAPSPRPIITIQDKNNYRAFTLAIIEEARAKLTVLDDPIEVPKFKPDRVQLRSHPKVYVNGIEVEQLLQELLQYLEDIG